MADFVDTEGERNRSLGKAEEINLPDLRQARRLPCGESEKVHHARKRTSSRRGRPGRLYFMSVLRSDMLISLKYGSVMISSILVSLSLGERPGPVSQSSGL